MLERLDDVPWADIEHAYGPAEDVPGLLRGLIAPDERAREKALSDLYGNAFHQGTRFPAAPHVIPFLIEIAASPAIPGRGALLGYWGHLIAGYFSVQERPTWGDGERAYSCGEPQEADDGDSYAQVLHRVYRESLPGHRLLLGLLDDEDFAVRAGAAWVLACLPTVGRKSISALEARVGVEPSGHVRAAIAFALGELGAARPLRRMLADDPSDAARCMAACELARLEPEDVPIEPLLRFASGPIEGYPDIPGAGGKSTGDAAFAISLLPHEARQAAIPALCAQLGRSRSFDIIPLVRSLLSAAFPPRDAPLDTLTDLQRDVLERLVATATPWPIGNLEQDFRACGLSRNREACPRLVSVEVVDDEALDTLRRGLNFADIGAFAKARTRIQEAIEADPGVFERAPAPDESWLLCARAFAETDPARAVAAFRRAIAINPAVARRVKRTEPLADLLEQEGPG